MKASWHGVKVAAAPDESAQMRQIMKQAENTTSVEKTSFTNFLKVE